MSDIYQTSSFYLYYPQLRCEKEQSRSCYLLNEDIHSGESAEKYCRSLGGSLAVLDTKTEEKFIFDLLKLTQCKSQREYSNYNGVLENKRMA